MFVPIIFSNFRWLWFIPGVLGIIFIFFYFRNKVFLNNEKNELGKAGVSGSDDLSLNTINTKNYALVARQLQGDEEVAYIDNITI